MYASRTWLAVSMISAVWPALVGATDGPFLVKPYLQLGHAPAAGKLVLMWHAADADADWAVEYRPGPGTRWQAAKAPAARRVAVGGIEPHRVYHAPLTGLEAGVMFAYRVSRGGKVVFEAEARAPKVARQPQRFVAFGDCGAGTPEQKAIAYRAFLSRPDYVMIPGDIVYGKGLVSEYRDKFWPIYNADEPSPSSVPRCSARPCSSPRPATTTSPRATWARLPDGMAYFYYWAQPLNGPVGQEGGPITAPVPGPEANKKAFLDAAGSAFPRMANFSFDYGDVHWTVLDANPTVDWTNPRAARSGSSATWPPPGAPPGGS